MLAQFKPKHVCTESKTHYMEKVLQFHSLREEGVSVLCSDNLNFSYFSQSGLTDWQLFFFPSPAHNSLNIGCYIKE